MNTESGKSWFNNIIGYQCFIDSYAMGAESIQEKAHLYESPVFDRHPKLLQWSDSFPEYAYGYAFYGGDLQGIIQSINTYLADFGIDMLYLTPIFKAETNHKYDTLDYKTVDPQFGDLDIFHALVNTCHAKQIKLILDGVFNHTSYHHDWCLKAKQGIEPFVNYYKKNEDGHILNWNGVDTLMLLNHEHPDVQDYLYNSSKSIVKYWLEQGADGWRLDVAERLGKNVIRAIKKTMSTHFDDKVLYGEVIESYGTEWLGDDLLDGAMNYVFLGTTANFLTNQIDGETFLFELTKMYNEYPKEQLYNSWNIISTHDTDRMIHQVNGNENLFKIAVTLQFTYPGVPMIYNGDELGVLPGQKDKDNRQGLDWQRVDLLRVKEKAPWKAVEPMDWSRINEYSSFYFFYKHLIWLRKNYQVFINGEFLPAYADDHVVAFFRIRDDRYALVIVNTGETKEISITIPKAICAAAPVLKGEHGPMHQLKLQSEQQRITVERENAYIFVSQ